MQWEKPKNPNKRRKAKQEEKCNQKAEEVLRFCTCRIGIPFCLNWSCSLSNARRISQVFFSSLWLRGESLFVNESVIETLKGTLRWKFDQITSFRRGIHSIPKISCDFVSVDFLNSIRFSCGVARTLLGIRSGCERFSSWRIDFWSAC